MPVKITRVVFESPKKMSNLCFLSNDKYNKELIIEPLGTPAVIWYSSILLSFLITFNVLESRNDLIQLIELRFEI
ncbi:hypothetical protein BpHYR1_004515 [Brachionus plicatilis]|uniref:Uncharacterized protein n=1 Tax=Brachionus plicatilis TaxID=10195 RepID=A0A3M7SJ88_BRAPC|nr:hypothetical protein BpHYR1_004515 [Brachionus plicatilis]